MERTSTLENIVDQVIQKINEAYCCYYRLILIVGNIGTGKTSVLQQVSSLTNTSIINVNLELSRCMLELTEKKRILQLPRLLNEIIDKTISISSIKTCTAYTGLVLLDNLELLFDIHLKQDPLRLLQKLSRNKTIVATWNGAIIDNYLTYAVPEHNEYRQYQVKDFSVVSMDSC